MANSLSGAVYVSQPETFSDKDNFSVVATCTASLTLNNSIFSPHCVFVRFVWISEQTAIIPLYNINWFV